MWKNLADRGSHQQPLRTGGYAADLVNPPWRFFYGPGQRNWDMALLKTTKLTETRLPKTKALEIRFEAFNVFNHAQFFGPNTISSNIANWTYRVLLTKLISQP